MRREEIQQGLIPSGYTQVSYVYSAHNSDTSHTTKTYFDTGVKFINGLEIWLDIQDMLSLGGPNYCGVRTPNFAFGPFESTNRIGFLIGSTTRNNVAIHDLNRHLFRVGNGKFQIDGNIVSTYTVEPINNNLSFWILNNHRTDIEPTFESYAKIKFMEQDFM